MSADPKLTSSRTDTGKQKQNWEPEVEATLTTGELVSAILLEAFPRRI